jgi:hypothetical protein
MACVHGGPAGKAHRRARKEPGHPRAVRCKYVDIFSPLPSLCCPLTVFCRWSLLILSIPAARKVVELDSDFGWTSGVVISRQKGRVTLENKEKLAVEEQARQMFGEVASG